jgi:hypothetical protein
MFDSLANSEDQGVPIEDAYHVGKVVFNKDPDKLQRIKVTIPGFMEDSDPEKLPWVGPIHPSGFGMNEKYGVVRVPMVDSLVVVTFQGGDIHHALYVGYVPTANFVKKGMPDKLKENYPNRVGYIDPKGTVVYTDVDTGEMSIFHFTGSQFTIEPDAKILPKPVAYIESNIVIKGNVLIMGDMTVAGNEDPSGPLSNVVMRANVKHLGDVAQIGNQDQTGDKNQVGNQFTDGVVEAHNIP